jgi:hypothetical protein
LSSCATAGTSLYDEAAGRKRGDTRHCAKLCEERRISGQQAAFFAPLIILARRAGAVETAAAAVHAERVQGALSLRCRRFTQSKGAAKIDYEVRKGMKG